MLYQDKSGNPDANSPSASPPQLILSFTIIEC
jgi:hypothetical protein